MSRSTILVPAIAALLAATPAAAQETAETLADRTALIQARTALEQAQADAVGQRLKLLGLQNDATGKTELGDKGGAFEGWLLSSRAVETAAGQLNAALQTANAGGSPLVLLADDETFDMSAPAAISAQIKFLSQQTDGTLGATGCVAGAPHPGTLAFVIPAMAAIGAIVSAIRTDTTITGYDGPDAARMVIAALVAGRPPGSPMWIVPGDLIGVSDQARLIQIWNDLATKRQALVQCKVTLGGQGDKAKAQIENVTAQIAAIDDFAGKQVAPGNGVSPLVRAAQLESVVALNPKILRIHVEKAGGSILNRRNLWTALGAPAIGITGGVVIGWRLADPLTGALLGGGNLICRTELTDMRAIQSGRVRASSCGWTEVRR